jgi:hypothetical protein
MTDPKEQYRQRVMSALDLAVATTFAWTAIFLSFTFSGVGLLLRPVVKEDIGWYGRTIAFYEANEVYALLGYIVFFQLALALVYWGVRKSQLLSPVATEVAAIVVAGTVSVCFLPGFLAGLVLDGFHFEMLDPRWLCRLAETYSVRLLGSGELPEGSMAMGVVIFNAMAWIIPVAAYAYSFLRPTKPYTLRRVI